MLRCFCVSGLVISVLLPPSLVSADPVTIRAKDNSVVLSGEIEFFDGENIDLLTPVGKVRVSRADVLCEGTACPEDRGVAVVNQQSTAKLSD